MAKKKALPIKENRELRNARERRGVTRAEMAKAVGISERHYRRLEQGLVADPGLRLAHNCALALGYSIYQIFPADHFSWTQMDADAPTGPPKWEQFFNPRRAKEEFNKEPDLRIKLAGKSLWSKVRWLNARAEALAALARTDDAFTTQHPILRIDTGIDPRLDRIHPSLEIAATGRETEPISLETLLYGITFDDGPAGQLLEEFGAAQPIRERVAPPE